MTPLVEAALDSLPPWGVTHPSDRRRAVWTFRHLSLEGEDYDPDEVAAWATRNGWTSKEAAALARIAREVRAGKQHRVGPSPYRYDIVQQWRGQARG